ncbi:MAG: hypothetical protein IKX36_03695 [Prevotella sp.]|nr:hypothetical protein [Prevotella sp.]
MKKSILTISILSSLASCTSVPTDESTQPLTVEDLAVQVSKDENREFSFTNKRSAYWYGRTHQDHFDEYFAGWNVATRRILSDYSLSIDGQPLLRTEADNTTVAPDCITRQWPQAKEQMRLIDNDDLIIVAVDAPDAKNISIAFDQRLIDSARGQKESLCLIPQQTPEQIIKVVPMKSADIQTEDSTLTISAQAGGFLLAYGTESHCDSLINMFRAQSDSFIDARRQRMNALLSENVPMRSNLPDLDKAMAWLTLTTDQLITCQQGKGIYAGLPWFNTYWGRDIFISLPGAALVTGQFGEAEEILRDFGRLQDRRQDSPTMGRIPNLATPDGVWYNTTDGTPRYVMETEELLRYTGDKQFLQDVYPTIIMSIEQAIARSTDEKGYLLHADADTWMDVKHEVPASPRGNRANDVQWLWYRQLMAGVHLAQLMNDTANVSKWKEKAEQLANNFEHDFCDKTDTLIYDHLNSDGTPDKQYRPNQLFCFELIGDENFKKAVTRKAWQLLAYPWGVASLEQHDRQFHPYHHWDEKYHFDDAYHNGTVWLWLNGIFMQRMIECGEVETAWQLFCNMNRQALQEGAVGSLSECADAHPRPGKQWADRSGTFLQAWSNAEQLRVWYQCFLGIQPDLLNGVVKVKPMLPKEISRLSLRVKLGKGYLNYKYEDGKFDISVSGIDAQLQLILPEEGELKDSLIPFCKPNSSLVFKFK